MFNQITYNEIKFYETGLSKVKDVKFFNKNNINISEEYVDIESLIINDITIQNALVNLFFYKREFDSDAKSQILLSKKDIHCNLVRNLLLMCNNVIITEFHSKSERSYLIQLGGINRYCMEIIKKIIIEQNINPVLQHFLLERKSSNDIQKNQFYKFDRNSNKSHAKAMNSDISNYLNFIKNENRYSSTASFINVSGYSVEELSNDEYVFLLSEMFEELYLLIYEIKLNDNTSTYIKQLRWY